MFLDPKLRQEQHEEGPEARHCALPWCRKLLGIHDRNGAANIETQNWCRAPAGRRVAEAAFVADPAAVAEAATTLEGAFDCAAGAAASGEAEEALLEAEAALALLVDMAAAAESKGS